MANEQAMRGVTRRRVFYIPGYDPIHPRRYRELYRAESAAQAKVSGYVISQQAKPKGASTYGWMVEGQIEGGQTSAQIDVLIWSDIVRDSMATDIPRTYLQLCQTAWTYITSGALRRLMMLRKGPVIAALYPVGMLLLQLLIAVIAFFTIWSGFERLATVLPAATPWVILTILSSFGAAIGAVACVWILRWFKKKDGKFFAYYLMHDYAFSARWGGANPPALEERMRSFGDTIARALKDNVDEVLIVGHSSGAHLAVSILADLIRDGRVPQGGPALSFLSLGQVVPMVSFLPKADRLRRDLHFLSASDDITWVDVTAPGDGCAFALCDPVAVSGVDPSNKKWPLVFSARVHAIAERGAFEGAAVEVLPSAFSVSLRI